jgi:hypothetical protein
MKTLHEVNEELKALYGETSLDFTDKGAATGHSYIPFYSKYMKPKQQSVKLLEIGVSSGGSAYLWSKYFQQYEIHTFDYFTGFASACPFQQELLSNPSVKISFAKSSFDQLWAESFSNEYFDFVIDDGDHSLQGQANTFLLYWPKVAKGGTYFIEDVLEQTGADNFVEHLKMYLNNENFEYDIELYKGHRIAEGRLDDIIIAITKK